jgi:hypothetical protein
MPLTDRSQLLKLARTGAEARLADLRSEIEFIYRSFPDLRRGGRPTAGPKRGAPRRRRAGVRGWTPAQRKEAAERMRKYWAARKAAKGRK